jgi:acyl-CoA carboxylase subunit beta
MGVLGSRLDPVSDAYRANRAANLELLAELERLLAQARAGGGPKYVERHRARGKLLAPEPSPLDDCFRIGLRVSSRDN